MWLQVMPGSGVKVLLAAVAAFVAGLGAMWLYAGSPQDRGMTEPAARSKQAASVSSPDARYRASVVLPDLDELGATVSQPHQVWISAPGGLSGMVLEADKTDGLSIKWLTSRQLEICYSDAQIHKFSNRFNDVERDGQLPKVLRIEIVLRRVQQLGDCQRQS